MYSEESLGVDANRTIIVELGCPDDVGIDGERMADAYQWRAPSASFSRQWRSCFERTQDVVLYTPQCTDIPWDAELDSWLTGHFYRVYARCYVIVYRAEVRA